MGILSNNLTSRIIPTKLLVFVAFIFISSLASATTIAQVDIQKALQPGANIESMLSDAQEIVIVEPLSVNPKQVRLVLGIKTGNSVYVYFRALDSAEIMLSMLKNNKPFVLFFDPRSAESGLDWLNIKASSVYVWDKDSKQIKTLGEVIGPLRSPQNQSNLERILIYSTGVQRLNNI